MIIYGLLAFTALLVGGSALLYVLTVNIGEEDEDSDHM